MSQIFTVLSQLLLTIRFPSGLKLTLRQLETVEVQVSVVEENTRQLADSTNRVADVIPTKISMPRVPVTKRFWVSRHRRLRWENRSTPDQRQKPQAMAT